MKTAQMRGFTLIELLVVIAIMGMLMAMVVIGLPRVLEKAKIADVEGDMHSIRTALTTYMADHGSYPPRYGYLKRGWQPTDPVGDRHYLEPYTAHIGLFGAFESYDRFNLDSHDTNSDNVLQPLEFCPSGIYNPAMDRVEFLDNVLYDGPGSIPAEEAKQLEEQGPYVYLPVNTDQFKKFKRAIAADGDLTSMTTNWSNVWSALSFRFPPPKYDAFVLISVGPREDTFGIISMNESGPDMYHKLALRAYYLATRDINNGGEGNGVLDFDFQARTRQKEATVLESDDPGLGYGLLPDVQQQLGPGPLIGKFE